MEKSIAEMRSEIVRYYEEKGYTRTHAEAYVPHSPEQVLRIYEAIQKEDRLNGFWTKSDNRAVSTLI